MRIGSNYAPPDFGGFGELALALKALGCVDPATAIQIGLTPQRLIGLVTVWILMGLVCFVFQMMIAARLQEIGSK